MPASKGRLLEVLKMLTRSTVLMGFFQKTKHTRAVACVCLDSTDQGLMGLKARTLLGCRTA